MVCHIKSTEKIAKLTTHSGPHQRSIGGPKINWSGLKIYILP